MTTDYGPLLDQIRRMPLLPDGVSVRVTQIGGLPHVTICHAGGIAALPADPKSGTVDARALRQAIADVMIHAAEGPRDLP